MARILVFGDSITYGREDYEYGGWVQRLRKFLNKKILSKQKYCFVYNFGVNADTTKGLLERFEFEIKFRLKRLKEQEDIVIIFAIGVNDACHLSDKNDLDVSPKEFRKNIQKLIKLSQKFSTKVIFVGLSCVDEAKTTPYTVNKFYKNEYIKKYNQIIKSICQKNEVYFIEIFENWIKIDYKKLLEDGLHPNTQGHKQLFETIKNFLIQNKITKI
jgi:acyl-CoA thioesterase-1